MKTVNHKGKVYQVDALYVGACNSLIQLKEIRNGEFIGVDSSGNSYRDEWLAPVTDSPVFTSTTLGTVIKQPITLEDGKAYQFTNVEGNVIHGIYDEDEHSFNGKYVEWSALSCTDIHPLTLKDEHD